MTQPSNHPFESRIRSILIDELGLTVGEDAYVNSPLIGYLRKKTRAANRGSKSRGSFANLYALYVLIEDYLDHGYDNRDDYSTYEGARFSQLMRRQRELPFGSKLQNHALNSRLNDEFHKFFPEVSVRPILRDIETQRYWITESLLRVGDANLARSVTKVVDDYVAARRNQFTDFIYNCKVIEELDDEKSDEKIAFVESLLDPNVDARVFEIVSFAIMKTHYGNDTVWIGPTRESVQEEILRLFKTGRTNANDGGIDFVMKPLGRFFQVTETLDLKKYFLDIDKVQRFPITFVVKTQMSCEDVRERLRKNAEEIFEVARIVDQYMKAVEDVVTIPDLVEFLHKSAADGSYNELLGEIVLQSRVEFNLDDDEEAMKRSMPELSP